jgi:glycine/D-amino acid oxidase-like deaminating enzyme
VVAPDVAVIGGGIIGCSAAAMLAQRGASVVLVEATAIGAGASGRNMGAIQHPFDPALTPLYRDSLERHRSLAADDASFSMPEHPAGVLMINTDPDAARRQVDRLAGLLPDLGATFLDAEEVAGAEPSLVRGFAACLLAATGYPVLPGSATAAWARLAERRGTQLMIGDAGEPWIEGGRTRGIRLADGSRIAADAVLIASGPWAPTHVDPSGGWQPIIRTWGVTVQLQLGSAAPRHIVEQDAVDAVNRPAAAAAEAGAALPGVDPPSLFTMASAGGMSTLGSTFLPDEPDRERMARLLLERGARYLPAIAEAEVSAIRLCARPQSVDGRPFIGPVEGIEGLFVCAGHGPWGISTGPGSAALAVAAILEGAAVPAPLQASRRWRGALGHPRDDAARPIE